MQKRGSWGGEQNNYSGPEGRVCLEREKQPSETQPHSPERLHFSRGSILLHFSYDHRADHPSRPW